ncbi:cyclin-dependent kinase G-2-like isoform X1 [Juglans microcarpa x Juglans regia]|uniref:cyclin-dependent kinase G-2-like isoform X1 n=1 Tax=Juglans microcarpa x Juglans regia TaxID=2249226 RepID=UPI001B7F3BCE|nr:cyclin-dependent kinase G-2-like isoform X1 [Juglans microcarpa x Juglans regia]
MAAGRHGGYRENEFRDRESNIQLSRRDFAKAKEGYDRIRSSNSNPGMERGRVQDIRDRGRVRQKDIKEREVMNGGYRSASSRSDSGSSGGGVGGPKRRGFMARAIDKEPGELSSESDDAVDSESQMKDPNDLQVIDNGVPLPPLGRKRKFSPIIWDRDDKDVNNSSRSRVSVKVKAPPPPFLPEAYHQSPNVVPDGGAHISPSKNSKDENLLQSSSPINPPVVPRSGGHAVSKSPVGFSPVLPSQQWGDNLEEVQLEDDYVPARNISSSRWADANSSPVDEGEIIYDEEIHRRRKKMPLSESLEVRVRNKSLSPEMGEIRREGSERSRVKSFESDELVTHGRSLNRDDAGNDPEKDDFMEIADEHEKNYSSASQLSTDSGDEDDSRGTPEPTLAAPPQRSVNMLQGCRSVDEFERLNRIDEGTYGVVYRARDKKSGDIVALKKVKMEKEKEGFPLTSLREINILLSLHHPSIIDVKEVVMGSSLDSIFMVMEYMEHDLKGLMETMKQPFSQSEVKCLMLQLLEGVKYLHDNWVLHRDLKASNLLLNNQGELKVCDFGLARQYGSPLKPYTHLVVTLWYRAPELLLGAKQYSTAIDMWSLGCIMAEFLSKEPLFNGKTEFDQLDKIFRILGTPNETIWPGFSKLPGVKVNFVKHQYNLLRKKFPATSFTGSPVLSDSGFDLLNKLLTYDPERRITAEAALNHEWFHEVPLPKSKEFMPTFPAQHAQDRRTRRIVKSPNPLEEQRRKELLQGHLGTGGVLG